MSDSPWNQPRTVEGFIRSPPNAALLQAAAGACRPSARLLDIGCGAGRNAVPLATAGWEVIGTDSSLPMLTAAAARIAAAQLTRRVHLLLAPMHQLPLASDSCDFIVAHGIWNLARSGGEFRTAVHEAARVARAGCALFLFTFSRHTIADSAQPLPGESFVFTEFSGQPQCFLTQEQIVGELAAHGFERDPSVPLLELNRPPKGSLLTSSGPVIYQGLFRSIR
jgi:ubiquinone/menaquinone biosynthesis C-methylase UbiE